MRPLVIGSAEQAEIKRLIAYAKQHRFSVAVTKKIAEGLAKPLGTSGNYAIELPIGYDVAYTVEEHPGGWFHHLSIRIQKEGHVANPAAMKFLMTEFGFTRKLEECVVFVTPDMNPPIVNIVEPFNG